MKTIRLAACCGLAFALTAGLSAGMAQAQSTTVPRADANATGMATLAEYQKSRETFIMRGDANKDGRVSKAEWDKFAAAVRKDLELGGVQGAELIGQGAWWNALDTNKDGVVTRVEIKAMTAANFARYDANKNGLISRAEAQQVRKTAEAALR